MFNVPPDPGRLRRPWPFPSLDTLRVSAQRLAGVRFLSDWRLAAEAARPGDLVLSDPPYLGGFTSYTAGGFSASEQNELAGHLSALVQKGCAVVAFNSPAARRLYASWATLEVTHRSGRVSSAAARRDWVPELLAHAGLQGCPTRMAA